MESLRLTLGVKEGQALTSSVGFWIAVFVIVASVGCLWSLCDGPSEEEHK
jgi:hypothetical protein